jgi:hypothetical protein
MALRSVWKDERHMESQDVSVDPAGKLELTPPGAAPQPLDSPRPAPSRAPVQPEQTDADTVREALIERQEQQEAEQSVIAEVCEEASSAEPVEPGALTAERPRAE